MVPARGLERAVAPGRGVRIWNEWADEDGELGPVYGVQWRSWPHPGRGHIDQIAKVVEQIRTNPDSRPGLRHRVEPAEVDEMALPPCHALFQLFYVSPVRDGAPGGSHANSTSARRTCSSACRSTSRLMRAAHGDGRAASRVDARRVRVDRRGRAHLREPRGAGTRAALPRPVPGTRGCGCGAPPRSSTTTTRTSRSSTTVTTPPSRRRSPSEPGCAATHEPGHPSHRARDRVIWAQTPERHRPRRRMPWRRRTSANFRAHTHGHP